MLDREDLNVGTITNRQRESGRDEKQIQMIYVMHQLSEWSEGSEGWPSSWESTSGAEEEKRDP